MISKKLIASFGILGLIGLAIIIFGTIYLAKEQTKRTDYYELEYDEFTICYDDDNYCYEIFTEDKMYTISKSKLEVLYDSDTYIVIYYNNYKWQYDKAILFIGVDKYDK